MKGAEEGIKCHSRPSGLLGFAGLSALGVDSAPGPAKLSLAEVGNWIMFALIGD